MYFYFICLFDVAYIGEGGLFFDCRMHLVIRSNMSRVVFSELPHQWNRIVFWSTDIPTQHYLKLKNSPVPIKLNDKKLAVRFEALFELSMYSVTWHNIRQHNITRHQHTHKHKHQHQPNTTTRSMEPEVRLTTGCETGHKNAKQIQISTVDFT